MSQKLWVAYDTPAKRFGPTRVSIEGCSDTADFKEEIKKQFSNSLGSLNTSHLSLYKSDGITEIDVGDSPTLLVDGNSSKNPLIVKTTSVFNSQLDQLDQQIKQLEESEEYKTLAEKNNAWAVTKPTEKEKGEWQVFKEKLAELKKKEDFYRKAILSTNAHSVKKSDKIRKGYNRETAIKDERLLLSSIARKAWEKFQFHCENVKSPSFGDMKKAAGFHCDKDVHDYFRRCANGQVEKDDVKESLTEEEWIWLIGLNKRVNVLLHDSLITNQDGSLRLVLEAEVYKDGANLAKNIILKWYGPEKKLDVQYA